MVTSPLDLRLLEKRALWHASCADECRAAGEPSPGYAWHMDCLECTMEHIVMLGLFDIEQREAA